MLLLAATLITEGAEVASSIEMNSMVSSFGQLELAGSDEGRLPPTSANGLTERQEEVLRLIARGKSNLDIANELTISTHTVARHISNIRDNVKAANRVELAAYANKIGLSSATEID